MRKLAEQIIDGIHPRDIQIDEELFSDKDGDEISLTLKNYNNPNGVAT